MRIEVLHQADATARAEEIADLLCLIPLCHFEPGDVVATHKRGVALTGRFQHNLDAVDGGHLVGGLLSYERPAEPASGATYGQVVYPRASFYLDGLAVAADRQGMGAARPSSPAGWSGPLPQVSASPTPPRNGRCRPTWPAGTIRWSPCTAGWGSARPGGNATTTAGTW